jgi:intracellular sulfur oxidation DsrE/DsrF family protein
MKNHAANHAIFRNLFVAASFAFAVAGTAHADYVAPDMHHAPYGEFKVVVPITSADSSMWLFRLRNVGNGIRVPSALGGSVQEKVVLYGSGIKLLSQPVDPKLKEAIDAARAAGVQFNVCNESLKGMNLDWHELYGVKEGDVVPSGFAEVGWLASHGWAVDPAN